MNPDVRVYHREPILVPVSNMTVQQLQLMHDWSQGFKHHQGEVYAIVGWKENRGD